ncbi:roundabout homolog 2-like [Limulus polyphemus]|uniref:Roundabout homolog 2-like n=1 Tax=Limulus polyphemus TaxID=6850 RepID=A0ABM1TIN4_LIMPO|nr:roundabout homolog 2-like [Limulus polyphemus]
MCSTVFMVIPMVWGLLLLPRITLASTSQSRAPRITEHPRDLLVKKQQPAKLNCKADGEPTPVIEWYHNGKLVEGTSNRIVLPNGGSLFFFMSYTGRGTRTQGLTGASREITWVKQEVITRRSRLQPLTDE